MNNFIEYFYGIKTEKILRENKFYFFISEGYLYKLFVCNEYINTTALLELNRKLLKNTLISEIIINRNNEIISNYEGINYMLFRVYANTNKRITLEEIAFLSATMRKESLNINWGKLWEQKIDYLEDLILENGKKYPIIVDSFNYFVGMAENAISYYNNIIIDSNAKYTICHKHIRFDDMIDVLYDPMNIIFDYKIRDVAEYIKNSFFNNNRKIFDELLKYMQTNNLSLTDVKLLISRLLYPSFYFELYDDILIDKRDEKIILDIVAKLDDYEKYLSNIILFFKKSYNIVDITWLKNEN